MMWLEIMCAGKVKAKEGTRDYWREVAELANAEVERAEAHAWKMKVDLGVEAREIARLKARVQELEGRPIPCPECPEGELVVTTEGDRVCPVCGCTLLEKEA